jgi:hypothetical protein
MRGSTTALTMTKKMMMPSYCLLLTRTGLPLDEQPLLECMVPVEGLLHDALPSGPDLTILPPLIPRNREEVSNDFSGID